MASCKLRWMPSRGVEENHTLPQSLSPSRIVLAVPPPCRIFCLCFCLAAQQGSIILVTPPFPLVALSIPAPEVVVNVSRIPVYARSTEAAVSHVGRLGFPLATSKLINTLLVHLSRHSFASASSCLSVSLLHLVPDCLDSHPRSFLREGRLSVSVLLFDISPSLLKFQPSTIFGWAPITPGLYHLPCSLIPC